MEILKVSVDEQSKLITITFSPDEILAAKSFFKELFSDDDQNEEYVEGCGNCNCNPCVCQPEMPYTEESYVDEPYKEESPYNGDADGATADEDGGIGGAAV